MNVELISSRTSQTIPARQPASVDWIQIARALWRRLLRFSRRPARRLRLCENLALGERRFVAVVEFENSRFLLGGTSASLVLLARLDDSSTAAAGPPLSDFDRTADEEAR